MYITDFFKLIQVDKVIGRRRTSKGKEEYLVHWKNYDRLYSTWEPVENLTPCLHTVTEFMAKSFPMPGKKQQLTNQRRKTPRLIFLKRIFIYLYRYFYTCFYFPCIGLRKKIILSSSIIPQ